MRGGATVYQTPGYAVWIYRLIALLALASLAMEFGFDQPLLPTAALIAAQIGAVAGYVALRVVELVRASNRILALRTWWIDGALLAGGALLLLAYEGLWDRSLLCVSTLCVGVLQSVILIRIAIAGLKMNLMLSQSGLHPTRLLALTFVGLILLGGIALSLPKATHLHVRSGEGFSYFTHMLNCLFTSTSATCVTGLAVYDTGADFTRFGQVVILLLIQAGGLGIMIFGGVIGLMAGQQLSLRQSLVLQDAISHQTLGHMRRMVIFIVVSTFAIEAIGAVVLYPMFRDLPAASDRIFCSVFHAISAFCNAGFALQSDSLVAFNKTWGVYLGVVPLIILGGLGFPVLHDLCQAATSRLRRRRQIRQPIGDQWVSPLPARRLSLHTKLVLTATVLLLAVPATLFFVMETYRRAQPPVPTGIEWVEPVVSQQAPVSAWQRWCDAWFLSVTCRTAGFNTAAMDPASLTPGTHALACVLMFVGGAPASTAGGAKSVTLVIMVLGIVATMRGRTQVEVLGRTIPETLVRRAAVVVMIMFTLAVGVTVLLCVTEQVSLRIAMFESVSALGTVGLSTGLTPHLTLAGRVVIMAAMFAGRLGPLSVLIALAGQARPARYNYPTEHVTIG